MHKILRNSAIAAALAGACALAAMPAFANSIQEDGDFGGTWRRIGPSDQYRYEQRHYAPRAYYGPSYSYYGPPAYDAPYDYDDGYAPGIALYGPGIGFSIGAY